MINLFSDQDIIDKLGEFSIEEIADLYEDMNDYSAVKRHKNGILIEFIAQGWSDNEHFLHLLNHLTSKHRREFIGVCDASHWYVTDKKYLKDYRFEIVPFKKEIKKADFNKNDTYNKIIIKCIKNCDDCPYYEHWEWEDGGRWYVNCLYDDREIESKDFYQQEELFKSCPLSNFHQGVESNNIPWDWEVNINMSEEEFYETVMENVRQTMLNFPLKTVK